MRPSERLVALDHLRGFVVGLVVLHHSVLAYCRFDTIDRRHYLLSTAPIVDAQRWPGFDVLVVLNDGFFMPLMFVLSGLFVWSGLTRKGPWRYLRDRLLRLGAPFAVAVLTIVPLVYYPSWLQAEGAPGFLKFWITMVTSGPWPSGPAWFVGVLLLLDIASTAVFARLRTGLHRQRQPQPGSTGITPLRSFGALLLLLVLAYLPFLAVFGAARWISFGPVAIQASRIGLYAACFAAAVAFGLGPLDRAMAFRQGLVRHWAGWAALAVLMAAVLVGSQVVRIRYGSALPGGAWLVLSGIALAAFTAAMCFALPAAFLRFGERRTVLWDSLAASSYGLYLLHYPFVTWIQYGLLSAPDGPIAKASATFTAALLLSWAAAALLRRTPGLRRVI